MGPDEIDHIDESGDGLPETLTEDQVKELVERIRAGLSEDELEQFNPELGGEFDPDTLIGAVVGILNDRGWDEDEIHAQMVAWGLY